MNLVLAHCGKEWRAQRGLLIAYSLLVFSCLALGLWLAPMHAWNDDGSGGRAWFDEGLGTHAVTWFFAAGVLGVLLFVAPNLVRAEFGPKEDQFVRRLPGALAPSFGGKLLFLLLAAAAFPLLGLLLGEIYVAGRGHTWNGLFEWQWNGAVALRLPGVVIACACAMLLVPWVWAIGCWLPGGRMAVGGTVLCVLLVGVCVFAVLRQSPGIEEGVAWGAWSWSVAVLGLAAAAVSWSIGRRGGGPMRSARFGLAATALGLVPPSLWFVDRAWDYHHPDPQQFARLSVVGLSPDGRLVLARGNSHPSWADVPFRIDLQTGAAEQIAGIDTAFTTELVRPYLGHLFGQRRWWRGFSYQGTPQRVFDLAMGQWLPIDYDERRQVPVLPAELRAQVLAEVRERTPLRAPGGERVWFDDSALCREHADGTVSRQPFPREGLHAVRPVGHGFVTYGAHQDLYCTDGRPLLGKNEWMQGAGAWVVRDSVVFGGNGTSVGRLLQRDAGGAPRICEPLMGSSVLGLFDDDHLLCWRASPRHGDPARLFLYQPADGETIDLPLPGGMPNKWLQTLAPLHEYGSLLARDPSGCIWLQSSDAREEVVLRLDTATREISLAVPRSQRGRWFYTLLGWPDARTVLIATEDARILRIDIATGERTVLFPRGTP